MCGTLQTWDITTIRDSIGMALLCRAIHEKTDIKVFFTGEISDELFATSIPTLHLVPKYSSRKFKNG